MKKVEGAGSVKFTKVIEARGDNEMRQIRPSLLRGAVVATAPPAHTRYPRPGTHAGTPGCRKAYARERKISLSKMD